MELLISHQSQFVQIYQRLNRHTDTTLLMKSLQTLIVSLKKAIMTLQHKSLQTAHFTILKLLYKLIAYTRDIFGGLGERTLTYCMLFIWKYHFPVPTAICLGKMVMSTDSHPSYGSWRDIKGLCDFIRRHSEKGSDDPFIETCIGLMNHQLDKDGRVAYDDDISLVSRWVPRETSKHKWLFDRCARQWMLTFRPHYFASLSSSSSSSAADKAIKKGKREYRLLFTSLSKKTDTLQIKQCANQWDSILPDHIPLRAMTTQQNALLNIAIIGVKKQPRRKTASDIGRNRCALRIQSWWRTHYSNVLNKRDIFVEMGSLVLRPLEMESLWTAVLKQIPAMPHIVPILDMSLFHTDTESFYHALGMALAIACKSGGRLVAFDKSAHFVRLQGSLSQMIETMRPIFSEHHIGSDLQNVLSLCTADPEFIGDRYIVFSDARSSSSSNILYWGSGKNTENYPVFCGFTNHTLTRIAELPFASWSKITPFIFVQYLLSNPRYDLMDTYFDTILS